jgi:hypothetical protein
MTGIYKNSIKTQSKKKFRQIIFHKNQRPKLAVIKIILKYCPSKHYLISTAL